MAPVSTALTTKVQSGSPYQLEKSQTLKASTALLKHIKSEAKRKETESDTKNLLAGDDDSSDEADPSHNEPIWLVLATKKHIVDKKRLKPGKIHLPHSLNGAASSTICLITADPQRPFKDTIAHVSFPTALSSRVTRVIGISKLKARYKTFETRRQLLSEHDVFLADDRVITVLPKLLGKIFYSGSKRPIPVSLEPYKQKDAAGKRQAAPKNPDTKPIAPPAQVAREIERTLSCAQVHLSPAATTSVRVGLAHFSPEQVADNVEAVVTGMVEKFVTKGWRNIRAIHIKGPNTMALPIWLADELWVDEGDILEEEEAKEALQLASQKNRKRKGREGDEEGISKDKKAKKLEDSDMSKEMAERREKLRQQKKEAREQVDGGEVADEEKRVGDAAIGKSKVKSKKMKAITAS
ncbi:MAG: ribosome biogenesis [Lasallia pustulata]|uniref:Ribosome biogenesis n=1 Tax=Lasallia pustulata TaxID=136370 RepID=A0A5M8PDN6_9LECA|nr:MAG: ribosome biogenesis [Lasallia pustulata]